MTAWLKLVFTKPNSKENSSACFNNADDKLK